MLHLHPGGGKLGGEDGGGVHRARSCGRLVVSGANAGTPRSTASSPGDTAAVREGPENVAWVGHGRAFCGVVAAKIWGMTIKERLHKLVDELSELEADAALQILIARRNNGAAPSAQAKQPEKVGRLPFFGIGEGGPPDAARRVDEFVGRAIDRRHPAS